MEEAVLQHFNHRYNFIDPDTGVNTQKIKQLWGSVKWRNKNHRGTTRHHLESYPTEFMWRRGGVKDPFEQILKDIPYSGKTNNYKYSFWGHIKCVQKLKGLLKKWSEEDFRNDPELSLIPSLYNSIKTVSEKESLTQQSEKDTQRGSKDTASSAIKKEEDDLAKAIELSLKESGSPKVASSLYPSTVSTTSQDHQTKPAKQLRKVRALYDFLAAEDNELSFKAGEIIHIIDDRKTNLNIVEKVICYALFLSDPSWFLGSNQNGQGLFPANFVTSDLSPVESLPAPPKEKKTVKFNEKVNVKTLGDTNVPVEEVVIDEKKIDEMLTALHDADPTGQIQDSDELLALEDHCLAMGPLIEQELERIDHRHAALTDANKFLVEALKSYEMLMKSAIPYASFQVPSDIMHSNMYQTPALQLPQVIF
ncbi:UNVERIFIED_CONTAM: Stam [Trichonephila clavipes]